MHVSKKPFLIGVTGGTASGKTTVCEMIIDEIQKNPDVADASVKILSQDLFYFTFLKIYFGHKFYQNKLIIKILSRAHS